MPGYTCTGCDGAEPVTVLITPLNGSETMAIGPDCMPLTMISMTAGVLDIDAEQLWEAAVQIKQAQLATEAQARSDDLAGESGGESEPGELVGQAAGKAQAGPKRRQGATQRRPRAKPAPGGEGGS